MNAVETLGWVWLIFSAAIAHVAIVVAAYRHIRRTLDLALRGAVEERKDVCDAEQLRSIMKTGR